MNVAVQDQLFHNVLGMAKNGVVVVDNQKNVILWNSWIEEKSGVPSKNALGLKLENIFEDGVSERLINAIDTAITIGSASLLSQRLNPYPLPLTQPENSALITVRTTVQSIQDSDENHFAVIEFEDFSANIARENFIQSQNQEILVTLERLFSIFETVDCAIIRTDKDGKIFQINKIGKDLMEGPLGAEIKTVISNKDIQEEALSGNIESEEKVKFITYYGRKVIDEMTWVYRDVTTEVLNERHLTEEREKSNQSQKLASLGEMAASIVHEIKSPLTVVMGNSQRLKTMLGKEEVDWPKIEKAVENVVKGGDKITRTVKGLLNMARDCKQDSLEVVLIEDIIEDVKVFGNIPVNNVRIDVTWPNIPKGLSVKCRPGEVSQVLLNLIKNAKEEIYEQSEPWVIVKVEDRESDIKFQVIDSGRGISKELKEKIFKAFFTTKGIGQGTGLGLSLCRRLIESQNGKIYIEENHPNTCFSFELPKR